MSFCEAFKCDVALTDRFPKVVYESGKKSGFWVQEKSKDFPDRRFFLPFCAEFVIFFVFGFVKLGGFMVVFFMSVLIG